MGKIALSDSEVPAPAMELVALLPHCGLSIPWLLTKSQIDIYGKHLSLCNSGEYIWSLSTD